MYDQNNANEAIELQEHIAKQQEIKMQLVEYDANLKALGELPSLPNLPKDGLIGLKNKRDLRRLLSKTSKSILALYDKDIRETQMKINFLINGSN